MRAGLQPSLIEPSNEAPIASSLDWIGGVMFGPIAVGLCALAVAFVGFAMLAGRWPLRMGFRVVLGCFVLLGAPVIATGLMGTFEERPAELAVAPVTPTESPRGELEPADYDPYAGASLRRE